MDCHSDPVHTQEGMFLELERPRSEIVVCGPFGAGRRGVRDVLRRVRLVGELDAVAGGQITIAARDDLLAWISVLGAPSESRAPSSTVSGSDFAAPLVRRTRYRTRPDVAEEKPTQRVGVLVR